LWESLPEILFIDGERAKQKKIEGDFGLGGGVESKPRDLGNDRGYRVATDHT
jgi:hypothetical protein